jgi:hypothetical protein
VAYSPTFALDCWVHRLILGFEGRLEQDHYEWLAGHSPTCDFSVVTFSWKFWLEHSIKIQLRCECGASREATQDLPFQDPRTPERQALALDGGWASQDTSSPVSMWQKHYQKILESSPHGRYSVLRRVVSMDPTKMWLSPHILDSNQYRVSSQGLCSTYPGRLSPQPRMTRQVLYRAPSTSGSLPAVYGPAVKIENP